MNIFEFAIEFERENRDDYLERSRNAPNKYISSLFEYLAEEERKHEEIIVQLREEKMVEEIESDIGEKAKDSFRKMLKELPEIVFPKEDVHIYKEALELERKSKEFYQ